MMGHLKKEDEEFSKRILRNGNLKLGKLKLVILILKTSCPLSLFPFSLFPPQTPQGLFNFRSRKFSILNPKLQKFSFTTLSERKTLGGQGEKGGKYFVKERIKGLLKFSTQLDYKKSSMEIKTKFLLSSKHFPKLPLTATPQGLLDFRRPEKRKFRNWKPKTEMKHGPNFRENSVRENDLGGSRDKNESGSLKRNVCGRTEISNFNFQFSSLDSYFTFSIF